MDERGRGHALAHADVQALVDRVPWYKSRWAIREDWEKANPGKPYSSYDPGGWFTNLLFKYPGWRVLEGYSQPRIDLPKD